MCSTIERIDFENINFALDYLLSHYKESGYQVSEEMVKYTREKLSNLLDKIKVDSKKQTEAILFPIQINWKAFID